MSSWSYTVLLKLFLTFTIIPFIEIYLLIKIGSYLGAFNTVIIVVLTAFFGALLARYQGFQTMLRVRESLERGEMPGEELMDALLILLAGIVLLTPGFLTDLAGLMILIPSTRLMFKRWLRKKFDAWSSQKRIDVTFW